ncbi:MAG TPA: hypothetical protein VKP88_05295 [Candidatus Paceibacterota bacterium]|nr:hypothetical protein [Candidatus Paceibacterota bacterium]
MRIKILKLQFLILSLLAVSPLGAPVPFMMLSFLGYCSGVREFNASCAPGLSYFEWIYYTVEVPLMFFAMNYLWLITAILIWIFWIIIGLGLVYRMQNDAATSDKL